MEKLTIGDGLDETVKIGPVINKDAFEKIHRYVEIGQEEGAKLLVGGEVLTEGELAHGNYYAPTLFTDVKPDMRIAQEEIFGPVVITDRSAFLEEAIEVNNGVKYGLSSSFFRRMSIKFSGRKGSRHGNCLCQCRNDRC